MKGILTDSRGVDWGLVVIKYRTAFLSSKHRGRGYSKQPANRKGTRLTAVKEQLEQQVDENLRLTNTIKLLEKAIDKKNKELSTKHKADMAQKLEIKKLSQSNDELRRELSKFKGMGKYVSRSLSTSDGCSNTDTLSDNNGQTSVRDSDKLYSLKQHVKSVAESLMAVIESDNDGEANLVNVTRRRQKSNAVQPN